MSNNKAYTDIIRARIVGALAEAKALREINHHGVVGALRETVIRQLITPLLPSHMAASTGIVTSYNGAQSRQCDIVIYDRRLLPPILVAEAGLFPIEAVIAHIEIKSRLDMTELRKAHEGAVSMFRLPMMSGVHDEHDQPQFQGARPPLAALFAFDSDIAKHPDSDAEIKRYQQVYLPDGSPPMIELVCVVGSGCWIDTMEGWAAWSGDEHEEVIGFLACLSNTLPRIAATRGEPRLGMYIGQSGPRAYVNMDYVPSEAAKATRRSPRKKKQ